MPQRYILINQYKSDLRNVLHRYYAKADEHRALTTSSLSSRSCSSHMRSFLSPETSATFQPTWLHTLAMGLQGLTEAKEKIFSKKEFKLWNSERYFAAYELCNSAEEKDLVVNQLIADLTSFFDEYAFLRAAVTYEYNQYGMRNGYTEKVSDIAHNFTERLRGNGDPLDRALLEEKVALYVESWMNNNNVQIGERLLFISPRGSQAEHYPGLDDRNYVFVNIYEKTETGFLFRQYRSYDPNPQLPQTLNEITTQTNGFKQKISAQEFANKDHHTIASAVHIPARVALETIESTIYSQKENWVTDIDRDLPQLPEADAQYELQRMLGFCLDKFHALAENTTSSTQQVEAFDKLVVLARKTLLKWVENRALNFDHEKQSNFAIVFQDIEDAWQLQTKKDSGEQLQKEEQSRLKKFVKQVALSPTLPIKSAASWSHCIAGTPLSLVKLQLPASNSMSMDVRMGGAAFGLLSLEQKTELKHELLSYVRIEFEGEVWYVPPSYLTGKGCYYDELQDLVMGPCGLPLALDPYALTESAYANLMKRLLYSDEELQLNSLSKSQKDQTLDLFFSLQLELFVRSASLEKILLQDILAQRYEVSEELHEVHEVLVHALNPQQALLFYLLELHKTNETTKIETLTKATKTSRRFSLN